MKTAHPPSLITIIFNRGSGKSIQVGWTANVSFRLGGEMQGIKILHQQYQHTPWLITITIT
jgi:hypothetical protein